MGRVPYPKPLVTVPRGRGGIGVGLAFAGVLGACGPSFQAVYEGNVRFEHCYALEENPQTLMPERAACWRDWSEHYTYGQTRDRIHYATARYVALSQAGSAPTDEALMMAAPGETPRVSSIMAPAPTNAFAPPPKVLEPGAVPSAPPQQHPADVPLLAFDGGTAPLPASEPKSTLPRASCADGCGETYRVCGGGCDALDTSAADAKTKASCQVCLKSYRACMRGCFR